MFFQIFIALFLGLATPCDSNQNGSPVTTQESGGEGGHIPPGPTTPPPPKA